MPSTGLRLSEILSNPRDIDWDGNSIANARDQWIELYNAGPSAVDLTGWSLDDAKGGSKPFRFQQPTLLAANAYLVLYRNNTGLVLDTKRDQVRLLDPSGRLVDSIILGPMEPDTSLSRGADGTWHQDWPPSPGHANSLPILAAPFRSSKRIPE